MINLKSPKNFCLLILILVVGCAPLQERARRIAGKSVDHLEKRRDQAISQQVNCSVADCFDVILMMGDNQDGEPHLGKRFEVFQVIKKKGVIVFYYIPNQVDTTEAAVFITPASGGGSLIEVVSLSSTAQEKVAKAVFEELKANNF